MIGDAVNLASRLESSTKELGVNVLISQDTYEVTKGAVETRPVRELTLSASESAEGRAAKPPSRQESPSG